MSLCEAAPRGRACRLALNLGKRGTRRRLSVSARCRRVVLSGHAATSALIAGDNLEQHSRPALFLLGRDMQSFCNEEARMCVRACLRCVTLFAWNELYTLSAPVSHLPSWRFLRSESSGCGNYSILWPPSAYPCMFTNVRCSWSLHRVISYAYT